MKWKIREIEAGIDETEAAWETDPGRRTPEQWKLINADIASSTAAAKAYARELSAKSEQENRAYRKWLTDYSKDTWPVGISDDAHGSGPQQEQDQQASGSGLLGPVLLLAAILVIACVVLAQMG